jgi:hypothetical protein
MGDELSGAGGEGGVVELGFGSSFLSSLFPGGCAGPQPGSDANPIAAASTTAAELRMVSEGVGIADTFPNEGQIGQS